MLGIHMNRTEQERVVSVEAKIVKADNAVTKNSKKDEELFHNMNSHNSCIKLTVQNNLIRFLDKTFNFNPCGFATAKLFGELGKFSVSWCCQIPKRHKASNINDELHHANLIDSDFDAEMVIITKRIEGKYTIGFLKSFINNFLNGDVKQTITPGWFFDQCSKILFTNITSFFDKVEGFIGSK